MRVCFILLFWMVSALSCAQADKILLWHSLAGQLGSEFESLIEGFNASQTDARIVAQYKGDYLETLTSLAAAKQAHKEPAMVQIFEVGSAYMLQTPNLIQPVDELMQREEKPLLATRLLPGIASFYTRENVLQAFPLNVSLPVMFYDVSALEHIGINKNNFPKDWQSFENMLQDLQNAGYQCGYTSAYPAWIHLEVFAAMHRLDLSRQDGSSYQVQGQPAILAHWHRLKGWYEKGYFVYGGRNSDATSLFSSGRCAVFSQSSGSYNSLKEMNRFAIQMAPIPNDSHWLKKNPGALFGGAGLWVMSGQSLNVQKSIAKFLEYLSQPQNQMRWYQRTGYLPMLTASEYVKLMAEDRNELLAIAYQNFLRPQETMNALPQNQLRMILDQALESVFANQNSVTEALYLAQKQINYRLKRYHRNFFAGRR